MKVLDLPNIPDKRSFPPRLLFVFLGTFLAGFAAVLFVLGSASWRAIDMGDPGKKLALDVWCEVKAYKPWISKNGHSSAAVDQRILEENADPSKKSG